MKRVIDLKGKAKERQEAKKKAAANTASVERCKYWCKTSFHPVGNVMAIDWKTFMFPNLQIWKTLLNHLTFAVPVLADSEWRRSCCHEAALVISTDRRGAKHARGPWHTTATSQQVRQTTHNLLHPVFHVFDMVQFAATLLLRG